MKAGESMRRNFAQILKDAKIDVKVEYQKLYGMLYDCSNQDLLIKVKREIQKF